MLSVIVRNCFMRNVHFAKRPYAKWITSTSCNVAESTVLQHIGEYACVPDEVERFTVARSEQKRRCAESINISET